MSALGVAVVGFGWMGRVHTQAYARVPHHFPELVTVVEDVPGRAEEAAERFGSASTARDRREVAADPRAQRHRTGRHDPFGGVGDVGEPLSF